MKPSGWFTRFANNAARATGHPSAFVISALIVLIWAVTGPVFQFSDTWQLVINTGTTIITFLMVFLIQNTQNRDSAAIHLKLDELIRSHTQAHNSLMDLEHGDEEILGKLRERYGALAEKARNEPGAPEEVRNDEAPAKPKVQATDRSR